MLTIGSKVKEKNSGITGYVAELKPELKMARVGLTWFDEGNLTLVADPIWLKPVTEMIHWLAHSLVMFMALLIEGGAFNTRLMVAIILGHFSAQLSNLINKK